ncbi:MAG: hypothetical protein CMJ81_15855 [Planctomycetaceae bacterium]|nr:hypothetical protein [Planctomycetaceae bacterium]MBP62324.1 hypothetical protein [Planctomycetaceae bacterium]
MITGLFKPDGLRAFKINDVTAGFCLRFFRGPVCVGSLQVILRPLPFGKEPPEFGQLVIQD